MRAAARETGFTVIELMTVVAIAAILAAVAFPSFQYLVATSRTKNASSDLYLALIRARSEAVKLNASVTLAKSGSTWADGWQILDVNDNVLFEQGPAKGALVEEGADLDSIVYLRSGRIGGGASPRFEITGKGWEPAPKRCISADPSGRPYVKAEAC